MAAEFRLADIGPSAARVAASSSPLRISAPKASLVKPAVARRPVVAKTAAVAAASGDESKEAWDAF